MKTGEVEIGLVRTTKTTYGHHKFVIEKNIEGERIDYQFPWRIYPHIRHIFEYLDTDDKIMDAIKEAIEFGKQNSTRGYIHNEN